VKIRVHLRLTWNGNFDLLAGTGGIETWSAPGTRPEAKLTYLAQVVKVPSTPLAEFPRRGRYFPLQKAIGAEPLG
jgi:hypothetical protein